MRGLFTVVEELIKWAFESASQFFQRFDGRNGVAIFDAGDVAAKQTGSLLDITLGEFLFFAQSAKPVTDNHGLSILQLVNDCKSKVLTGVRKRRERKGVVLDRSPKIA